MLDVKEAVSVAFQHVQDLFSQDKIVNLGLEEVEFNHDQNAWSVTVGFSRPWDLPKQELFGQPLLPLNNQPRRDYKVVSIDADSGRIYSVKNRSVN